MRRCSFLDRGWEAGVEAAATAGHEDGYALGTGKGFDIGRELGFYYGAALLWQQRLRPDAPPR